MKNSLYVLTVFHFACTKSTGPEKVYPAKSATEIVSSEASAIPIRDTLLTEIASYFEEDKDLMEDYECARGVPEPILDSLTYPQRKFFLTQENEGIEKAILKNGDEVTITHSGCEYILATFEFETDRFHPDDKSDMRFWAKSCANLLDEVNTNANASFDMDKGIQALKNFYFNGESNALGEEIDFGGEDIRSFVSMDNIQKVTDNEYKITVTFGVGPL